MRPTRAQALILILCAALGASSFARADDAPPTPEQLEQAAIDVALWGMPLASFDAMRQAIYRDLNVGYNSPIFWSDPANGSNQSTTPNTSAFTLMVFFNTRRSGPMVIDVPAAGEFHIFGSLITAWNTPIVDIGSAGADRGQGGRYVLLPPDFTENLSAEFIAAPSRSFNNYAVIRFVPRAPTHEAHAAALALLQQVRIYPLDQSVDPQPRRFTNATDRTFNAHPQFDESLYRSIARMLNEETGRPVDANMIAKLNALGMIRGRRFDPDDSQQTAMLEGAQRARSLLQEAAAEYGVQVWPNRQWRTMFDDDAIRTRMTFVDGQTELIESRAIANFLQHGPMARPELAGLCVKTFVDRNGDLLTGDRAYTLNLPADVVRSAIWSVAVYDADTCAFIRESSPVAIASQSQRIFANADGSVNITFSSRAPTSVGNNWIPTAAGKRFFVIFRASGPGNANSPPAWLPGDLEVVE